MNSVVTKATFVSRPSAKTQERLTQKIGNVSRVGADFGVKQNKNTPAHFAFRTRARHAAVKASLEELGELEEVPASAVSSRARTGFSASCEAAINDQINTEYNISYVYHSLYAYFSRDNVALPGLAAYYKAASIEEREHAEMLMDYQNTRGGQVDLKSLMMPEMDIFSESKGDALSAMEVTLSLEKMNYKKLLGLHQVADENSDVQLCDFVESALLDDQVTAIKEVSDKVTELRRVGPGMGVWQWDQALAEEVAAAAGAA
mmetsp:Transcript_10680/g.12489  ORF Transcript_10680/g.12489 Transcript_10680/m.12489 type:complete len:260 (+) Transcript_10680:89-868(+)|eukprot:CAMPEP_0197847032 /NCGR_PEP_ID=MMETSP1438-20131217/5042_1 /TAXON_ID=1461541 /ORGANISM="Pterosperma sp., Strain CCMP1384" /LENGTH=259 /DNA_ID=CAMNT_0043458839 /DNA_START=74 /DNA_END=853 /DNA_ORIENTATION=+